METITSFKSFSVIVFLLFTFSCSENTTGPKTVNYIINNAEDISKLADITTVTGNLTIETGNNLVSLEGLESIVKIEGDLIIKFNTVLTSLNGLENLATIGGELYLADNLVLTDLQGLTALTSVGTIQIINNHGFASFAGLNILNEVKGFSVDIDDINQRFSGLKIENNPELISINALATLAKFDGFLIIKGNDSLLSIQGLNNVTAVLYLDISSNSVLINLSGLNNLQQIKHNCIIESNSSLENIQALSSLTSVESLRIFGNPVLSNLDGLENLTTVSEDPAYGITISFNEALTNISALKNLIRIGNLYIYKNYILVSLGLDKLSYVAGEFYIAKNYQLLTSLAIALRDQVISLDGIDGEITIEDNL